VIIAAVFPKKQSDKILTKLSKKTEILWNRLEYIEINLPLNF
jgi:hypothetical protein